MKLILQNGYPFPLPEGFDADAEGFDCRDFEQVLEGVRHFEWKHELTIEFKTRGDFLYALNWTGWEVWDNSQMILAAPTSAEDGYAHPAIIVKDRAYCGFILVEG